MKKLTAFVFAIALGSVPAFAQMADFNSADLDGDGEVTIEEAVAAGYEWTPEQFNAADSDSSGGLSEDEFDTARAG